MCDELFFHFQWWSVNNRCRCICSNVRRQEKQTLLCCITTCGPLRWRCSLTSNLFVSVTSDCGVPQRQQVFLYPFGSIRIKRIIALAANGGGEWNDWKTNVRGNWSVCEQKWRKMNAGSARGVDWKWQQDGRGLNRVDKRALGSHWKRRRCHLRICHSFWSLFVLSSSTNVFTTCPHDKFFLNGHGESIW